ncbi:glycosyltransferase family 39 protein [cf. Phormidesmis sp. LEGE 11477]|uniref:glycosyltransferase family 39 protein n=1 Tax=cf. Phormidesmis sp. LEGE 11477 TaxID=1828680 RepID=UPI00187F72C7|nr:glycosyltransferase family 39 protein [cf. Phormidesmis sp. LEGE 11477]MBE9061895.1 glycosyltransferase family 39 protein [cf. Phormidesmis sp. LEGE 11477]
MVTRKEMTAGIASAGNLLADCPDTDWGEQSLSGHRYGRRCGGMLWLVAIEDVVVMKRWSHKLANRLMTWFLWGSVALGIILRFLWVGKREFWYDEVLSLLFSAGQRGAYKLPKDVPFALADFSGLLRIPPENGLVDALKTVKALILSCLSEPHPPLLYLSEHGWMRVFGNGEGATRSLVMLMSIATLGAAYYLGQRLLGERGGLIFTALLALNPFFLSHSLNLRMYSPLALWACLSGLCLLALMGVNKSKTAAFETAGEANIRPQGWRAWLLRAGVVLPLTAGLMTQYLFGYWFFALSAFVLFVDRKRWFQHGLLLGGGALLFMPWFLWGTLRQVSNRKDVLERLSQEGSLLTLMMQHGRDLAQTMANYLLLGHLTTGMLPVAEPIKPTAVAVGCGAIAFVVMCVVGLIRRRQYWVLISCGLLGLFPLLLALGVDVVTNNNTLGFGWGRATFVVLPGMVLLVAAWLEKATGRWREGLTAGILAVYLAVNLVDFEGRDRQMFHSVNAALLANQGSADQPTLVAMNSKAWGHVNRLIYYLDEGVNPEILVSDPADLETVLASALEQKDYARVLWLRANYPLWNTPETEAEVVALAAKTDALLQGRYEMTEARSLEGTMNLDSFELQVYQREA